MVKMGSCKRVNMKSSINEKWRPLKTVKQSKEKKLKRLCLEGNEWDNAIFQGNLRCC